MNQRLYRSRDDRIIAGVAGGVADYLNLDPSLVRIAWALLTIFTGGLLFLVYIIMLVVVPEEPYEWTATGGPGELAPTPPPPPVVPGWTPPGESPSPGGAPAAAAADTTTATADWHAQRMADRAVRRARRRERNGFGAVIFGIVLVLIGGFFLVQAYLPDLDVGRFWPIILVIVGMALLLGSFRPGSGRSEN